MGVAVTQMEVTSGLSDAIDQAMNPEKGANPVTQPGVGEPTTTMFRAVDATELQDIQATGSFNPSPNGTEYKGFSTLRKALKVSAQLKRLEEDLLQPLSLELRPQASLTARRSTLPQQKDLAD